MDRLTLDINNMNEQSLSAQPSEELIKMVLVLKDENEILKRSVDTNIAKGYEERLEFLEREINKDKQYARRDSVEIMGIGRDVDGAHIEDERINILNAAKVMGWKQIPIDLGYTSCSSQSNGKMILKFVNRKFATTAISNRSNLKDDFTNILH